MWRLLLGKKHTQKRLKILKAKNTNWIYCDKKADKSCQEVSENAYVLV